MLPRAVKIQATLLVLAVLAFFIVSIAYVLLTLAFPAFASRNIRHRGEVRPDSTLAVGWTP